MFQKARHVNFDQTFFLTYDWETVYYKDQAQKKLLFEWGISLEQVPKKLPAFYQWLQDMGRRGFALDDYKANEQWVREFCTNWKDINLSNPIIRFRVRWWTLGPRQSMGYMDY